MRYLLLKAKNYNWGLIGPGSWDERSWKVYDDGSYILSIKYRPEDFDRNPRKDTFKGTMDKHSISELNRLVTGQWSVSPVDACDGEAWEFTAYDNKGEIHQLFDCGYIYGVEVLEKIANLLPNDED